MSRILVAVPTFESILPDTFKSIWDMDAAGHELLFEFVRGYDCAQARINIVERARALGAGKILMVDSDVVVPRDALANLDSHGVGVCLGFYAHKDAYDGRTCLCKLGRYNFDRQYGGAELLEASERGDHLIEVKGGGLGCALIDVGVFERIPYPWFKWTVYADGHGVLSEDLYFCDQCSKAGIPVYADTRVACGHVWRQRWDVT